MINNYKIIIVRPALTYGSSIWAEAGPTGKIPERIVKPLRSIQRKCLKLVAGAYNSTSSRVLEHESSVLPIEIYLKQRRVQHAGLSDKLPVQETIRSTCKRIKLPANGRETPHALNKSKDIAEWTRTCQRKKDKGSQKEAGKIAACQEWKDSWTNQIRKQCPSRPESADPEYWKAANIFTDEQTGSTKMNFKDTHSNIHRNLTRAQSSVAIQLRSEHIGLNSYLSRRKVPGVEKPSCQCGYPSQNVKHMVLACPQWANFRCDFLRRAKDRSFEAMMNSPEDVVRITQ